MNPKQLGEYTIAGRLGGGSYGQVYRGIHVRSGHEVAIKLLDQAIDQSPRVITEARAAAAIHHPNVVQVFDFGVTTDRRPFIVMEALRGTPLSLRWQHGRVPVAELLPIATAILHGLAAAHRKKIVHRDLKPSNVFITDDRVVIVDWGLAKMLAGPEERSGARQGNRRVRLSDPPATRARTGERNDALADPKAPHLTITGTSLGTPRYMSPEQIQNKPLDGRTDLYALGVILYEALAGAPPFTATATFELLEAHVADPPPALPDDVPRHIADAIHRALEKDPADRFRTADDMRRALRGRRRRRQRLWPYALAAAVLTITAVAVAIASS